MYSYVYVRAGCVSADATETECALIAMEIGIASLLLPYRSSFNY